MTTSKKSFDAVQKTMESMATARIAAFIKSLENNLPAGSIKGKEFPATTLDNWIRRARDHGRLADVSLNRVAFELWKRLDELGAVITQVESCMIIPVPDIESKLARAVGKQFARSR